MVDQIDKFNNQQIKEMLIKLRQQTNQAEDEKGSRFSIIVQQDAMGLGNHTSPEAPPPPGTEELPQKPTIIPSVKMRQYNWMPLNYNKIKGTIWEQIDDLDIKLDAAVLESLFAANLTSPDVVKKLTESKAIQTIELLDGKRSRNICITLTRFAELSFQQIRAAILNLDEEVISLDNLQALTQYTPTPEEIELLKPYTANIPLNLGKAEQYFLAVMDIPLLGVRLECWEFTRSFDKQIEEANEDIVIVIEACQQLQRSKKFTKVLQIVLAIGNLVNGNTNRGGAWGFKLASLLKLLDTKSGVRNWTLMNFLANEIDSKYPEVRDFALELSQIERAAQQNKNLIAAKIGKIKSGIAAAEEYLSSELVGGADQLKAALKTFFAVASQTLQQTKDLFRDMEKDYQEIVEKFGESASSTSQFTDFFGYIHGFCNVFEAARKENQRQNLEDNKKPLTTVTQKIMMKLEMKKRTRTSGTKRRCIGQPYGGYC